jgi:hypothetical protein
MWMILASIDLLNMNDKIYVKQGAIAKHRRKQTMDKECKGIRVYEAKQNKKVAAK